MNSLESVVEMHGRQLDISLPNNDSKAYSSSSSERSLERERSARSRSKRHSRRSHRSRSRSYRSHSRRRRHHSYSRSPEVKKKRYMGNRENPERSR